MIGTSRAEHLIALEHRFGAAIYDTLPGVVFAGSVGPATLIDVDGQHYLDLYSAYSANLGHGDSRLVDAMHEQMVERQLALTARCVHHDQLGPWMEMICTMTGMDKVIPKNAGAEAVETAFKAMRLHGHMVQGVPDGDQVILVMQHSFSGRTITTISAMDKPHYRNGFGPLTPGFRFVPFNDINAMAAAIDHNVVGVFMEPVLGEGGVVYPDPGYLKQVVELMHSQERPRLVCFDEIQTGWGRTGTLFAWQSDGPKAKPDLMTVGKAVSGGMMPVSALLGCREVMGLFRPGMDGSTYGGNPLACAVSMAAMKLIHEDRLVDRSASLGHAALTFLQRELTGVPGVVDIRGRGLFIGIEMDQPVRPLVEKLLFDHKIVLLDTSAKVLRIAPPLLIDETDLQRGINAIIMVIKHG